uniref:Uncharacterized protein n=1 Tax=viral metagenome TaxID=1070528 RepID=A0A6C0JFV2_9ZZZZ
MQALKLKCTNTMATFIPSISATRVAGVCGLHKYQKVDEVFYELFCKDKVVAPKIREVEMRLGLRSFASLKDEVFKDANIRQVVYSALDAAKSGNVAAALEDVEVQSRMVLNMRYANLGETVLNQLVSEARGEVSKKRGLNNEDKILNTYEADNNVQVVERNTKNLKMDFPTFKLAGRTDGWVAAHNRIVDSKDRTRFFPEVPIYDEIQLRVYMRMSGATEAELIERFPHSPTRTTKFLNDPVQWAVIENSITAAVVKMNQILESPTDLERVVRANTVRNGGAMQ